MSVALARTADAFKEPTDNYQLDTEQNNDTTQVIPYGTDVFLYTLEIKIIDGM